MTGFEIYFKLGWQHILDPAAYDHLLFIVVVAAIFQFQDWKRVIGLLTAFTIGHSLTLAIATLDIFNIPSSIIEFLIPLSIFVTALYNLFISPSNKQISIASHYLIVLFFGFIHGMGFSNGLKALLGKESNIIESLFAFNLGIELGQIIIFLLFLMLSFVFINVFKLPFIKWRRLVSSIAAVLSLYLLWNSVV